MCGEYGERTQRPHYHLCLFGHDWPDKKFYKYNDRGEPLYTSEELSRYWQQGQALTSELTFENAAYTARYITTKVTGQHADAHYLRHTDIGPVLLEPEYNRMSLKPGIGETFYHRYHTDIYPHDYVVSRGHKSRPPRYYDELLERNNPDTLKEIKERRQREAATRAADNTPARLKDKETVTRAAIKQLKRKL